MITLSIVMPVYNGSSYIAANVRRVAAVLRQSLGEDFEIIVVDDGSRDETRARLQSVEDSRVSVLGYTCNGGKGHAVMTGLTACRGRYAGWIDGDLDLAPEGILACLAVFDALPNTDAVVGSKLHPGSAVNYPPLRRVYSWGFRLLVRVLLRLSIRDTQVGLKVFRRELLEVTVPLLLVKRYAFDVELLAVARTFGFENFEEVPVELRYQNLGTEVNWSAVWKMLQDTLAIAYRIHLRHHYARRFAALHRQRLMQSSAGGVSGDA